MKTLKKKVDIFIKMAKMVAIRLFLGRTQLLKSIKGFEGIFVPFEGGGGCLIWHFNKITETI